MSTIAQLMAYREIRDKLSKRRSTVLGCIATRIKGMTNAEIADKLGVPINEVTGRVTELRKMGHVVECGTRINKRTGRANTVWTVRT